MKKQIYINIGGYYASKEPSVLHTVLGSCVAACLMDHENRIGGMNHILLPGKADLKHLDHCTRYGINAMELLIRRLLNLGAQRRHLTAKVFGGGNVLPTLSEENRVGRENVAFAMSYLHNKGIRIKSRDVGGDFSRKIYFHTDTGDVFLKRIQTTSFNQTNEEEQRPIERTISSSFEVCFGKKSSLDI